jgi:hypothetical protein
MTGLARPSSNFILSSERMLSKDYNRKCSVDKMQVVIPKGLDAKTN